MYQIRKSNQNVWLFLSCPSDNWFYMISWWTTLVMQMIRWTRWWVEVNLLEIDQAGQGWLTDL